MDYARELEGRVRALEARADELDGRIRSMAETHSREGRVLDELSARVNRLTDVATFQQMRIEQVVRNTDRILALLDKTPAPESEA